MRVPGEYPSASPSRRRHLDKDRVPPPTVFDGGRAGLVEKGVRFGYENEYENENEWEYKDAAADMDCDIRGQFTIIGQRG